MRTTVCVCRGFEKWRVQLCVSVSIVWSVSRAVVFLEVLFAACRVLSIVSLEILFAVSRVVSGNWFEVCHVLSCLWTYCLKCVTCCRVSGNIV
jgi:hypothetical protein